MTPVSTIDPESGATVPGTPTTETVRDITFRLDPAIIDKQVNEIISNNSVVVFSKSWCPFCLELKRTLKAHGIRFSVFEIDRSGNDNFIETHFTNSSIQGALGRISERTTVPNVFVNGESRGGCNEIKAMEHSGQFNVVFAPFVGSAVVSHGARSRSMGLFFFPEAVSKETSRLNSLFIMLWALLTTIYYKNEINRWAALALAIDFTLRLIFGPTVSFVGMFSTFLLCRRKPTFVPGPTKQFATACGVFFSVFASGLYLGGEEVGGCVVMAILTFAAFLECFFDICLGCWIFGWGIKYGFIPNTIYRPFVDFVSNRNWAYDFSVAPYARDCPKTMRVHLPGQQSDSAVDLVYKSRFEAEYKVQDFHPVRHLRVDMFAIPMSFAALSYVFLIACRGTDGHKVEYRGIPILMWDTGFAHQVLGIVSVILFGLFAAGYLMRFVFYTKKVVKEWCHPIQGNYFSAISICLVLYGLMFFEKNMDGGITLVWIGSAFQLFIATLKIADLVFNRVPEDILNPSILMSPVGNFIGAIAFALYKTKFDGNDRHGIMNYLFISRLWFGVASLFAIVLFTITFRKAIHDHHSDNRTRFSLYVWLATASVFGPAYLAVSGSETEVGRDVFYQSMWCIAAFFFVLMGLGWVKGFFTYIPDNSIWIMPFSLSVFAFSTMQYYMYVNGEFFHVLSLITVATASAATAVCGLHFMTSLLNFTAFAPRQKWGPVNFMKLTHEAFRHSVPKILMNLDALDGSNMAAVDQFVEDLNNFLVTHHEHSRHEDLVIFPRVRRYFPGLNIDADKEHSDSAELLNPISIALDEFSSNPNRDVYSALALLNALKKDLPTWSERLLEHLRSEEESFTVAARKNFPIEVQNELVRQVLEITAGDSWVKVLPYTVRNLPHPEWKARYLQTFVWAQPSRAQEIGMMVYRGVDSVTWNFLARQIPAIIPRGVCGHRKHY